MPSPKIPFQLPCGIKCKKARACIAARKCVNGQEEAGQEPSGSEDMLQQRVDTSETLVVHTEFTETNVDEVGSDTNEEAQEPPSESE